ncbi:hypothetical protein Y1Q_0006467 [Alligator mississippiensis]|uniref:Secreted protein n=1 Tax=Alligator mississippiensis TaxID=8496 RepID=A0A151MVA9_ALLMI|nr:hypothetical protein Y1Q_0006467 [Alligator mississippiensis]
MRCLGTIFIWMLTIQERSVRGFLLKGGQGQRKTCSPGGSLLGSPEALHEPVVRDLGGSHQIYRHHYGACYPKGCRMDRCSPPAEL